MRLVILLLLVVGYQFGDPLTEDLKHYESNEKEVCLKIEKVAKSEKSASDFKLKKKTYYKIIPPKFKVETMSLKSFDETKWTEEMGRYFQLVDEQIMVRKGGYKWVVSQDDEDINLAYKMFPGEFITIKKVAIKPGIWHGPLVIPRDTVLKKAVALVNSDKRENRERIQKEIKKGYTLNVHQTIDVCLANGTIEEITRKEYNLMKDGEMNKFLMKKGNWKIRIGI